MWRKALAALMIFAGSAPLAVAQSVPFKDLEGAVIDAEMVYSQTFRTNGKVHTNENHTYLKLAFGPDDAIEQTATVNILATDGRQLSTRSTTVPFVLNKPRKGQNGAIVWTYEGGSLTRMQAFLSGARRVSLTIARKDGKLAWR
ncbi:MAG: hypothetical protein WCG92_22720 [Hyphomicrobiales bacterium]|nr:hypothetical protein [Alphaproteobacteria bacterium]